MNAKSTILLATLCLVPAEHAVSTVCKQASLYGHRVLVADCGDGSCGVYQVGSDGSTNLGFGGMAPDRISFEFYSQATGTFNLAVGNDRNYATCNQCILILQDVSGSNPQKYFFQTAGLPHDRHEHGPGSLPSRSSRLSWSDVTLAEVTIDPDNLFTSTLGCLNGDCYTIVGRPGVPTTDSKSHDSADDRFRADAGSERQSATTLRDELSTAGHGFRRHQAACSRAAERSSDGAACSSGPARFTYSASAASFSTVRSSFARRAPANAELALDQGIRELRNGTMPSG
jgi:hypothetical protein